jgi:two-component system phosphate regulon response regulator PhoB
VGELRASKPAWKRRRASEKDDELLEMLADGLGRWFARQLRDGHVARPSVLIVDPDESAQRFIRDALQEVYDVVSVADGVKAMAEARSHPPSLIFLDPRADRANGFSVCQALKADPRTRQTPIILLAAREAAEAFRGAGNGGDGYVTEPFDAEELRAQVRQALRTGVAA